MSSFSRAPPNSDIPGESQRSPARRRTRRLIRQVCLATAGAVVLAWLLLFITKGRFLKHPFERAVGSLTGRTIKVGGDFQLYFAPLDLKFLAERLTIANPRWATRPNLVEAQRVDMRIVPWSLIFGSRRLRWLDVAGGTVNLEWNAAHTQNSWSFSAKKRGTPFELPIIDRADLARTIVHFDDPRMRFLADLGFQTIRSQNARIGSAVRFSGSGTIRATPFTVAGALLSPDATAARGKNRLILRAFAARNQIDATGTLPSLADVEDVPIAVAARGGNLSELLEIIGVVVPQTRAYRLSAQLVKNGVDYRFTHVTGQFGDSDLTGGFVVHDMIPRVHITADLITKRLDIVDVVPFIGYNPDLVAKLGTRGVITRVAGAPRLLPNARLRVDALRNFDADVRYKVGVVRSKKVPLSNIDLTLALNKSLLTLSPLSFDMARGHVSSSVVIDARRHPVHTTYDIRLAPTPIARLLAGFGALEAGATGTVTGRIKLQGDGDSVHDSLSTANGRVAFVVQGGTFSTRNIQLSELDVGTYFQRLLQHKLKQPVRINCGLVAFTVRSGVAAADPILIDTSKNVITARGGFTFSNEALDLAIRGDGKKFSLFSGQSPIALGGYLAAPTINPISGPLLARAGIGLGIAIVAPPAALLAFVDLGDAKAAACGPVLAGANASAQRTTKGAARQDVGNGRATERNGARKKVPGIF